MKILVTINSKQKCDAYNCKNDADFFFAVKGRASRCCLCSECLSKLAGDVLSTVTPKSPKNTIKRLADKREQEKNAMN